VSGQALVQELESHSPLYRPVAKERRQQFVEVLDAALAWAPLKLLSAVLEMELVPPPTPG